MQSETIIQVQTLVHVGLKIILHCFFVVVMKGQVCSKLALQLFQVQNKTKTIHVIRLCRQTAFVWHALHLRLGNTVQTQAVWRRRPLTWVVLLFPLLLYPPESTTH